MGDGRIKRMSDARIVSRIYTSEPQLTRAMAAEVRHCPEPVTQLLEDRIGARLGRLVAVECEKDARVDIMCRFACDGTEVAVAIEAKLDHFMSREQIDKEQEASDYLVALVLDVVDASVFDAMLDAVITWQDLLAVIPESRVRLEDIDILPAQKVHVERFLKSKLEHMDFGPGWKLYTDRGGSAMPGITIESPISPSGDQLVGQIQVCGRGMPENFDDVHFEYYVGTRVYETDDYYPDPASGIVPAWVTNACILYTDVLAGDPSRFEIKTNRPGTSKRPYGKRRKELTNLYLTDQPWLAQGYVDWALGVRVTHKPVTEFDTLAANAMELFTTWYAALENK